MSGEAIGLARLITDAAWACRELACECAYRADEAPNEEAARFAALRRARALALAGDLDELAAALRPEVLAQRGDWLERALQRQIAIAAGAGENQVELHVQVVLPRPTRSGEDRWVRPASEA